MTMETVKSIIESTRCMTSLVLISIRYFYNQRMSYGLLSFMESSKAHYDMIREYVFGLRCKMSTFVSVFQPFTCKKVLIGGFLCIL